MHIYAIRIQGHLDQYWSEWFCGLILGNALMVPPWVEVMGYAVEGLAIAWSAFPIWRESKPASLSESVA